MKQKILYVTLIMLLLLVLPAVASDNILGIYGNANEDETINMQDVTFTELIILEYQDPTELADAKYDSEIDILDVTQIELIILGREKEITVVDSADRIVIVKKPLDRVVCTVSNFIEAIRSLKLEKDKIVGVTEKIINDDIFFPEFNDYTSIGGWHYDLEKVISLNPDAVFTYASYLEDERKQLEDIGITVLCFDLYRPGDIYIDEIRKLGYITGKRVEAEKFIEFYETNVNFIEERVQDIPEDERPRVYLESTKPYSTTGQGDGWHQKIVGAGGYNIFSDLSNYPTVDAEEVMKRDPEIIVKLMHGSADPGAIHQEYLTEYQELDYNVYEHGVFIYPPQEEIL